MHDPVKNRSEFILEAGSAMALSLLFQHFIRKCSTSTTHSDATAVGVFKENGLRITGRKIYSIPGRHEKKTSFLVIYPCDILSKNVDYIEIIL
jgi:predicted small secreted protein